MLCSFISSFYCISNMDLHLLYVFNRWCGVSCTAGFSQRMLWNCLNLLLGFKTHILFLLFVKNGRLVFRWMVQGTLEMPESQGQALFPGTKLSLMHWEGWGKRMSLVLKAMHFYLHIHIFIYVNGLYIYAGFLRLLGFSRSYPVSLLSATEKYSFQRLQLLLGSIILAQLYTRNK